MKKKQIPNRRYIQHTFKGKNKLVSWIQRRCVMCNRFLSLHQRKYCRKCSHKLNIEYTKRWNNMHPENLRIAKKRFVEKYYKGLIKVNSRFNYSVYKDLKSLYTGSLSYTNKN